MLDFNYLLGKTPEDKVSIISLDEGCTYFKNLIKDTNLSFKDYVIKSNIESMIKVSAFAFNLYQSVNMNNLVLLLNTNGYKLPVILNPDYYKNGEYCVAPIMYGLYQVNDFYVRCMKNPVSISDCAYYPIIERPTQSTFREWLSTCKQKYFSHFFGEKSKRISWKLISCLSEEMEHIYSDTLVCNIQHNQKFIDNFGQDNKILHWAFNLYPWCRFCRDENCYVICGYDNEKSKYVAAMYVYVCGDGAYLQNIATSKEEEYKPYGLVLAAHYAAVRDLVWSEEVKFKNIKYIDLGLNFDDCASYKDSMRPIKKPILNLPNFTSFDDLERYL